MYIVSGSKTKVTGGGLKINSGASTILRARDSIHGRILYSSLIDVAREHPHLRSTINKIGMSAVSGGFDMRSSVVIGIVVTIVSVMPFYVSFIHKTMPLIGLITNLEYQLNQKYIKLLPCF